MAECGGTEVPSQYLVLRSPRYWIWASSESTRPHHVEPDPYVLEGDFMKRIAPSC
jgi:hypothetical protein